LTPSVLSILPLSPQRFADFLRFFEGDAFADNPAWASCYCQCFYEDHSVVVWKDRTAAENRALARQRTSDGRMQGYLAYLDGQPVGWCNAVPRTLAHALDDEPIPNPHEVGTLLCFVVSPEHRGHGVATALLGAACDGLRAAGFKYVEAYPRPGARTSAENHFGPLSMFVAAGFEVMQTDADGSVRVLKKL
jgi:GNAT superfamily N-acetyltransferase